MIDTKHLTEWERRFRSAVERFTGSDTAHDISHILRVRANAGELARAEAADVRVVIPAVWFHDCVQLPKGSADANKASRLSADHAVRVLAELGYSRELFDAIHHAIEAHSFSAGVRPQTVEARVVQDADRLDALGAIGIARCFAVAGRMGRAFYDLEDPFASHRPPNDSVYTVDHFYTKLLRLVDLMQTESGRVEARRRTAHMHEFIRQLASEIGEPEPQSQQPSE